MKNIDRKYENVISYESRVMALKTYDDVKFVFKVSNTELTNDIQKKLFDVLICNGTEHSLTSEELIIIVKQFLLNLCAMTHEQNLKKHLNDVIKKSQNDFK